MRACAYVCCVVNGDEMILGITSYKTVMASTHNPQHSNYLYIYIYIYIYILTYLHFFICSVERFTVLSCRILEGIK